MRTSSTIAICLIVMGTFFILSCKKDFVVEEYKSIELDTNPDATPYQIAIPPFFAPMEIPESNPMTVELINLGKHLFWDVRLSGDNTIACASCHLPENSFSDPAQFSVGINGNVGSRQAMALINLGWSNVFFWDGRALSIEEQVVIPVEDHLEMDENWNELVVELQNTDLYPSLFAQAFNSNQVTKERSAKALSAFMRILISSDTKFDQEKLGLYEFTDAEARGLDLFLKEGGDPDNGQGGQFGADCFHCHGFGSSLFTDNLFHNNGLDSVFTDLGLGAITNNALDNGKFKTPTLRNVELTAPYMHDGRFSTLEEVIEHYNSGGHASSTIDPFMKYTDGGLQLSELDKTDLIAFLKCLTDAEFTTDEAFLSPF